MHAELNIARLGRLRFRVGFLNGRFSIEGVECRAILGDEEEGAPLNNGLPSKPFDEETDDGSDDAVDLPEEFLISFMPCNSQVREIVKTFLMH